MVLYHHGPASVREHPAQEQGIERNAPVVRRPPSGVSFAVRRSRDQLRGGGHARDMVAASDRTLNGAEGGDARAANSSRRQNLGGPAAEPAMDHRGETGKWQIGLSGGNGQHLYFGDGAPPAAEGVFNRGGRDLFVKQSGPAFIVEGVVATTGCRSLPACVLGPGVTS